MFRMFLPSKLPAWVTPKKPLNISASAPKTDSISAGVQTKNLPSSPSLSASVAE